MNTQQFLGIVCFCVVAACVSDGCKESSNGSAMTMDKVRVHLKVEGTVFPGADQIWMSPRHSFDCLDENEKNGADMLTGKEHGLHRKVEGDEVSFTLK